MTRQNPANRQICNNYILGLYFPLGDLSQLCETPRSSARIRVRCSSRRRRIVHSSTSVPVALGLRWFHQAMGDRNMH